MFTWKERNQHGTVSVRTSEQQQMTFQASLLRPWYPLPSGEHQEYVLCQKYVSMLANACNAQATYWDATTFKCTLHAGLGTQPVPQEKMQLFAEAWMPRFVDAGPHDTKISFFADYSYVWLPLQFQDQRYGICILSFPHPHSFGEDERKALLRVRDQWISNLTMLRTLAQEQREVSRLTEKLALLQQQASALPLLPQAALLDEIERLLLEIGKEVPLFIP